MKRNPLDSVERSRRPVKKELLSNGNLQVTTHPKEIQAMLNSFIKKCRNRPPCHDRESGYWPACDVSSLRLARHKVFMFAKSITMTIGSVTTMRLELMTNFTSEGIFEAK